MRPYVHVNVAISADGKLSTRDRRQVRISGQSDFERVDRLRSETDAIMVGIGTVLADDPSLTVKSVMLRKKRHDRGLDEHPIRVVVDSSARTPLDASVLREGEGKRVIACSSRAPLDRIEALKQNATVIVAGSEEVDLAALLDGLGSMGVGRLMVEGGGTLIWGLISLHLVDEITCYIGNILIGGRDAPTLAEGEGYVREEEFPRLHLKEVIPTDDGLLVRWTLPG